MQRAESLGGGTVYFLGCSVVPLHIFSSGVTSLFIIQLLSWKTKKALPFL